MTTYALDQRTYTITGETSDGLVTATFERDGRTRQLRNFQVLRVLTCAHRGSIVPTLTSRGQAMADRVERIDATSRSIHSNGR